ncbi:TetR/AcrR family transcriptional regulator [Pectobacterium carotovorum]|uniref:TetR family transcriptional regulator n=1 Tax=Pectobacterium carotovorum subsp. carotovorum TaxID=555 RepID=A0AAI9L0J1_PECCC|nr:TetR/AcrR family transcriptional regulator [Pectobacterium carotovorum]KHT34237.1 TetR family transcriptional regulator [Pectobacterium carotovorum subsp. carotovorum]MDK9420493.1 TetR/AcrR family transcriptional regulator [Pectobacterium carotovorum]QHP53954.1 TetR/AcrR family transcriptional regulator [Pectobacterium carotovorum subsp. carotovorum]QLL93026.1 TetR/AcrR family transcriptional regulator [Pectobacterium carotovorum]ULS51619.1 TetR/AcrR family transcriptional regulator [Pectob
MVRRTRAEMEETRATLLATARKVFSERGYADTSMDDLTAQASLTRGALYHHFGDKKGLLAAVVEQIDAEMDERLQVISDTAEDAWEGFRRRCCAYLEMAREPEIQRIVLRDARAVLGGASPDSQRHCVESMQRLIDNLIRQGVVADADPQALASLIYGSLAEAAFWIAEGEEGNARLAQGVAALELLLRGLLVKPR